MNVKQNILNKISYKSFWGKRFDNIPKLKVNHSADEAIQQIKEKQYALRFEPKIRQKRKYTGRILAVGIAYDKESKKHSCNVEVLKKRNFT